MIQYHGTPCSGSYEEAARFLAGRHALIPWPNPNHLPIAMEVCQSFCLDNGAYGFWKAGNPIDDWTPYFQWVLDIHRHPGFDFAIPPDVIDGTEDDNNKLLVRWYQWHKQALLTVPCAPVWHMHESLERLKWLCETHKAGRVCFGSSGDYATVGTVKWWNRMGEAQKVACDDQGRPLCKQHGLRMLDPAIFHRLPLASADSTNAVRNGSLVKRFGMYCPPSIGARQSIIADRIESHQSAAVWEPETRALALFELERAPTPNQKRGRE